MPANTPKLGYPYPLPDDAISDYPALGQSLAEQLDAELVLPPGNAVGDVLTWSGSVWIPVAGIASVGPPAASAPPTIVGAVNAGASVARGAGVWTGNPPPGVTWEWLLNDGLVQSGGDNYVIPADASGKTLKLRETATNPIGSSSAEVTSGIGVGIQGSWEATRAFLDLAAHQGPDGTWNTLPWASNPDNAGDEATTPALLVADQWGIGLVDNIVLPATGTYRFEFHMEFPDNWTHGSSGDVGGIGSRLWLGSPAFSYGEVQDNNRTQDRTMDVAGLGAGTPVWVQWSGGATGKAPRPNNIRLRITHLG